MADEGSHPLRSITQALADLKKKWASISHDSPGRRELERMIAQLEAEIADREQTSKGAPRADTRST
jgi:hypothetical protein